MTQEMGRIDMDKIAVKDILAAEKNYTEGPKERRYFFFCSALSLSRRPILEQIHEDLLQQ